MLTHVYDLASMVIPATKRPFTNGWYSIFSLLAVHFSVNVDVHFLNYGFAELDHTVPPLELETSDEPNRYGIQLYRQTIGAVDLRGRDVLEVGCGRGGGTAYIHRYHQPRSVVGLDQCQPAVAFCQQQHRADGLSFVVGDAESLPFDSSRFDALVSVESSHCYPHMERFLREVHRVLRPGGTFLFSDNRLQTHVPTLRQQLACSGLDIEEDHDITPNVLRALDLDAVRLRALIRTRAPWPLAEPLRQFAALPGTKTYEEFRTSKRVYLRYVLHKMDE